MSGARFLGRKAALLNITWECKQQITIGGAFQKEIFSSQYDSSIVFWRKNRWRSHMHIIGTLSLYPLVVLVKYCISWLRISQTNMRRRLPRSPASIKGKNKTYKKIKSSARAENSVQTSWSKLKLTITKSGVPVLIRVLTDTQRRGSSFLLFCFPILC